MSDLPTLFFIPVIWRVLCVTDRNTLLSQLMCAAFLLVYGSEGSIGHIEEWSAL